MRTNRFNRFLRAISNVLPYCLVPMATTEATSFQAVMRLTLERNKAMYELEQYNVLCRKYIFSEVSVEDFNDKLKELLEQATIGD